MKKLEDRLKAETYEHAVKAHRVTKMQEIAVMSIFILIVTPAELSIYFEKMVS